ncbi:nucleotidyltransferase domain-containing protein [Mammaliicoccus sciuri]
MEKYKKMIEQFIFDNDEILAAYYGGSIARNDSDSYSDIDLRLVVNEQTYKDKLLSKFTDSFENILFIEDKDKFLSQIKRQSDKTVTISPARIAYIRNKYLAYLIETYKREKEKSFIMLITPSI